jgi:hypothetical protein
MSLSFLRVAEFIDAVFAKLPGHQHLAQDHLRPDHGKNLPAVNLIEERFPEFVPVRRTRNHRFITVTEGSPLEKQVLCALVHE